jgi:hypothetical protein
MQLKRGRFEQERTLRVRIELQLHLVRHRRRDRGDGVRHARHDRAMVVAADD